MSHNLSAVAVGCGGDSIKIKIMKTLKLLSLAGNSSSWLPRRLNHFPLIPITQPISQVNSRFAGVKNFRLAVFLTLGLCLGNVGWSKPSLQSIVLAPNP